jgi:hypothetical protein
VPVRAVLTAQSIARRGFKAYLRWYESMPMRVFAGMMNDKLQRQLARQRNENRVA